MELKRVLGLMSGTSLDGLDVVCVTIKTSDGRVEYNIEAFHTFPYTDNMKRKLSSATKMTGLELGLLENDWSVLVSQMVEQFLQEKQLGNIDFISIHGQTVFHQPQNNFTLQIGNLGLIAEKTRLPVVGDFRRQDVALEGQGAPLVPIGDMLLFDQYDACVNIGGFSNLSFNLHGKRIAFDVSPVNIVLNELAQELGLAFDKDGGIARENKVNQELLQKLNDLPYFKMSAPKSLGIEWVQDQIHPILQSANLSISDQIATLTELAAFQLSNVIKTYNLENILITGGGAFNLFLMERIQALSGVKIEPATPLLIESKEALIFALLGYLRWYEQPNVLSVVTGAKRDTVSGAIYMP